MMLNEDQRKVFLANAKAIYNQLPDSPGYDAFIYKYKDEYLNSGAGIRKNTFVNLFRKDDYKTISRTTALKTIRLLDQFLHIEDRFTTDDGGKTLDAFTETIFTDSTCPSIKGLNPGAKYYKYLQDYYVYFYRSDSPEVYSGILSLYIDNHIPKAYLLAYLPDETVLNNPKTWSIFNNMHVIEDTYQEVFPDSKKLASGPEYQNRTPAGRLYKSSHVILDPDAIRINLEGTCGYDGKSSIILEVGQTIHTSTFYQGGLGVFIRWSTASASLHISNIALVSCCNEHSPQLKNSNGSRKIVNTSEYYLPPLPPRLVGKELQGMSHPDVFSYFPRDDRIFYAWLKMHNNNSYRQLSVNEIHAISPERIDELIGMLTELKNSL